MSGRLLDPWTRVGLVATAVPLLLWGGVSVTTLTHACQVSWLLAWIPAVATSGVMIAATLISMTPALDTATRRYAGWLAAGGIVADILAAGAAHYLESQHATPPPELAALMGGLPSLMGGLLIHVVALVSAQRRREAVDARAARLAAEQAAVAAAAERDARARADTAAAAARALELDHQRALTAEATRTAHAGRVVAEQAERVTLARQATADAGRSGLRVVRGPAASA
ncbi:MAG: hypothetical protein ACRD0V_21490, partial [Acidimicrobiales bacterium]